MDNRKNNNIEEFFKIFFNDINPKINFDEIIKEIKETEEINKEKIEDIFKETINNNKFEEINLKEQLLQSQEKINKGIQENINAIKLELSFYDTNKSKVIKQIEDIQDFKNFIEFSSYNDLKNFKELKDLKLILDEQEELYKTLLLKHKDIKILSEKLLKSKESELEISKKFTEHINNLDL